MGPYRGVRLGLSVAVARTPGGVRAAGADVAGGDGGGLDADRPLPQAPASRLAATTTTTPELSHGVGRSADSRPRITTRSYGAEVTQLV